MDFIDYTFFLVTIDYRYIKMDLILPELVSYIMKFLPDQTILAWTCTKFMPYLTELKMISNNDDTFTYLTYKPYCLNKLIYLETDYLSGNFNSLKTLELLLSCDEPKVKLLTLNLPSLESINSVYYRIDLIAPKLKYLIMDGGYINGVFMKLKQVYLSTPCDMRLTAMILDEFHINIGDAEIYHAEIEACLLLDVIGIKKISSTINYKLTFIKHNKPDNFKESIYWKNLFVMNEHLDI
jgi:hypothetical protein